MRLSLLFVLFFVASVGSAVAETVTVRWSSGNLDAIDVAVEGQGEYLNQCVRSGFEGRVRFEVALCRRRQMWFDRCSDTVTEVHGLRYDAVTNGYSLTSDTWGDLEPPRTESNVEEDDALLRVASIGGRLLSTLGWESGRGRYDIRLRVVADCKGEYNELLARIPYFLTFGLVRVNGFDSGTVTFSLDGQPTR